MKTRTSHKVTEIIVVSLILFVVIGATIVDFLHIPLPNLLTINIHQQEDLMYSILGAHVSFSTLSIAVIALIVSRNKDRIYGVEVTKYIVQTKPYILKHKTIIISVIISCFLNYIAISYNLFNISVAIFFSGIILICIMVIDTFEIFLGEDTLRQDIRHSLEEYLSREDIENLQVSTIRAFNDNLTYTVEENIDLLLALFVNKKEKITANNNKDVDVTKEQEAFDALQNAIAQICNNAFGRKDFYSVVTGFQLLLKAYKIANQDTSLPLFLWGKVYSGFYGIIRTLPPDILDKIDQIDLQNEIYKNINTSNRSESTSGSNTSYLATRIYNELKRNTLVPEDKRTDIIRELLSNLSYLVKDDECSYDIAFSDISNLTATLIVDSKFNLIKELLFCNHTMLLQYPWRCKYRQLILAFAYYYCWREPLVPNDIRKDAAKKFFQECQLHNTTFEVYHYIGESSYTKDRLDELKEYLFRWELDLIPPDGASKTVLSDDAATDYFIFTFLLIAWDQDSIDKFIRDIADDSPRILYQRYFAGQGAKENTVGEYITFFKDFCNYEIEKSEAESKIDQLESAFQKLNN